MQLMIMIRIHDINRNMFPQLFFFVFRSSVARRCFAPPRGVTLSAHVCSQRPVPRWIPATMCVIYPWHSCLTLFAHFLKLCACCALGLMLDARFWFRQPWIFIRCVVSHIFAVDLIPIRALPSIDHLVPPIRCVFDFSQHSARKHGTVLCGREWPH
jgi:hypothetical protein